MTQAIPWAVLETLLFPATPSENTYKSPYEIRLASGVCACGNPLVPVVSSDRFVGPMLEAFGGASSARPRAMGCFLGYRGATVACARVQGVNSDWNYWFTNTSAGARVRAEESLLGRHLSLSELSVIIAASESGAIFPTATGRDGLVDLARQELSRIVVATRGSRYSLSQCAEIVDNSRLARPAPRPPMPPTSIRSWRGTMRRVGVEVEHASYNVPSEWLANWPGGDHVQDVSCGHEGVTPPIAGEAIKRCLLDLTSELKRLGTKVDARCSNHVHVDASDLRWPDMARLLRVYALVEPALYAIGGQSRAFARYSKQAGTMYLEALSVPEKDQKSAIMSVAYSEAITTASATIKNKAHAAGIHMSCLYQRCLPAKKSRGRYLGLNIIPWLVGRRSNAPDTTVEFRIHRASLDGERLAHWAHMLACIVEYASKATDKDVSALPRSALRALTIVAPAEKDWIVARIKAWHRATTATANTTTEDEVTGCEVVVKHKRLITVRNGTWVAVSENNRPRQEDEE